MAVAMLRPAIPVFLVLISLALSSACGGDSDGETQDEPGEVFSFGLGAVTLADSGFADHVSAMAFAPDGRLFYTEQFEGNIRILNADGTIPEQPFAQIEVADWAGQDWGLTGLALDPDFGSNGYVYAFYSELVAEGDAEAVPPVNPIARPTIVRFTDEDGVGEERTVISEDFPDTASAKAGFNANGEIHFGPDGKLYASIGDYDLGGDDPDSDPDAILSLATPIGKLLRMNPDGSAPDDNPFVDDPDADPRIYATGFREPFPFTFADDGTLYSTDNTTVSCEELNVIEAGLDYGWPQMGEFPYSDCAAAPGQQPNYNMARDNMSPGDFVSFVEVSGLAELLGSIYGELGDSLMVCESRKSPDAAGQVHQGVLKSMILSDSLTVESYEQVSDNCFGEVRTLNGEVYYATQFELRKLAPADEVPTGDATEPADEEGDDEQQPPTLPAPAP